MSQEIYALVDLETTGGNPVSDRITEVGLKLVQADGSEMVWQTLVNPGAPIPEFIQAITGITPPMLQGAPRFGDIAQELHELLQGCVFVAHNARFDYAFLKQAFARCNLSFRPRILCTLKLARTLYPDWPRHSLDAICGQMAYQRQVSHRALADVAAMQAFIEFARADHGEDALALAAREQWARPALPQAIDRAVIDSMPDCYGVYRFYGDNGALLYVGKSNQLRSRVMSHFSADHASAREMKLAQAVRSIDWTITAGELGALLLENREIKQQAPVYNKRQRPCSQWWHYQLPDTGRVGARYDGYIRPRLWSRGEGANAESYSGALFGSFRSSKAARKWLAAIADEQRLCRRVLGLERGEGRCFAYQIGRCRGACVGEEAAGDFNLRLQLALERDQIQAWRYSGPVVVPEYDEATERSEYHVINQWCHVATVSDPAELAGGMGGLSAASFDPDAYRILRKWLKRLKAVPLREFAAAS